MAFALTVEGFVSSIGGADRLSQILGADDPDEVLPPLLSAAMGELEQALAVADYPRATWPDTGDGATLLAIHGYGLVGKFLQLRMPELPESIKDAARDAKTWLAEIRAGSRTIPGLERAVRQTPRLFMSQARPASEAIPPALYDFQRAGRH